MAHRVRARVNRSLHGSSDSLRLSTAGEQSRGAVEETEVVEAVTYRSVGFEDESGV